MKQHASVLVVVLGLLAILAVIGVAFLTLSSLERSTATSFALQTQMMIAADGALDYAVHQMVTDVWEWNVTGTSSTPVFNFTGNLLTGREASGNPATPPYYGACETYDCPSAADPWLSTPIVENATPAQISFGDKSDTLFWIKFGSQVTGPDNLGMPVTAPAKNGIWIPDLAAPCDQYLIRASVTILDHGALLNMNAHGNFRNSGTWEYNDCGGKGYFISDVVPPVDLNALLFGTGAVPGCWGSDGPGNPKAGAVLIENPRDPLTGATDIPYTLDEEFELRNLWGTHFKSRLEYFWDGLDATPDNPDLSMRRLKATTVSWTAEVRGDGNATSHAIMKNAAGTTDFGWSAAKADLNTASPDAIYEALRDGRAWEDTTELKQLVANIVAFRRKQTNKYDPVAVGGTNYVGAARQPIFTEVTSTLHDIREMTPGDPTTTRRVYKIKAEVYNPWDGNFAGDATGLDTTGLLVKFVYYPGHWADTGSIALPTPMTDGQCFTTPEVYIYCYNNKELSGGLQDIRLYKDNVGGKTLMLDKISGSDVVSLETETTTRISRKVSRAEERRSSDMLKNAPVRILYVTDWQTGGTTDFGTVTEDPSIQATAIPVRFPHCVSDGAVGLPVRAAGGADFKAFAHVGDINQVLRFLPGTTESWSEPWICIVCRTQRTQENNVKFDWMKNIDSLDVAGGTAAAYAANVLSAGGPWNDVLDNDGDKKTDFDDTGRPAAGQTGGPECRVAGKINLNTATPDTLSALASGVGAPGLGGLTANRPFKSPAQILKYLTPPANASIEQRDSAFTLISNIATVRSDTFSVYGTVQIVNPPPRTAAVVIPDSAIIRTRRFWALVDRSPSLAYPPTDKTNFIYPRILNFQWLD